MPQLQRPQGANYIPVRRRNDASLGVDSNSAGFFLKSRLSAWKRIIYGVQDGSVRIPVDELLLSAVRRI